MGSHSFGRCTGISPICRSSRSAASANSTCFRVRSSSELLTHFRSQLPLNGKLPFTASGRRPHFRKEIYVQRGGQDGSALADWLQAEGRDRAAGRSVKWHPKLLKKRPLLFGYYMR